MEQVEIQKCSSWTPWFEQEVASQSQPGLKYVVLIPLPDDPYTEYVCACMGYVHRGHCKHQKEAATMLCHWRGLTDEDQTEKQAHDMICPRCGADTIWGREFV